MVGGLSPAAVVDALLGASGRPEQTHVHEAQRADEGYWKRCQPQLLLIAQLTKCRPGFSALFSPSRRPLHKKATSHKFLLMGLAASFLLPEGCGSLLQVFVLNCRQSEKAISILWNAGRSQGKPSLLKVRSAAGNIFAALPPLQGGQAGHQAPETARRSLGPAGHCRRREAAAGSSPPDPNGPQGPSGPRPRGNGGLGDRKSVV